MKNLLCQPYLALLLATSLTLSACGSSNTTAGPAPNTGNIPNLSARPSSQAAQVKKLSLAGNIFNGLNQKPIEKAEITLQIMSLNAPPPENKKSTENSPSPETNKKDKTKPGSNNKENNQPANSNPPASSAPGEPTNPAATPTPFGNADPSAGAEGGFMPGGVPGPALPGGEGQPFPIDPGNPLPEGLPEAQLTTGFHLAYGSASGSTFQIAQASQATKKSDVKDTKTDEDTPNVFTTTSNNRGKFFINDVPDGTYMVTITAPGYRSLTLTNINPNTLSIPLTPLTHSDTVDVVGMVISPSENPIEDAFVSPSFPLGEAIGVPANTNSLGEFLLPAVQSGKHSLLAFVLDERQEIQQMGMLMNLPLTIKSVKETNRALDPKTLKTPVPTQNNINDAERKKLEKSVEDLLIESTPSPDLDSKDLDSEESETSPVPPSASPILEPAASPESPMHSESDSAETSKQEELTENEEEEKAEKKGFNLLDAVKELVTGEKATQADSDEKVYPVIPLRSVLNSVKLSGTVTLPEDYSLRQVEVYLSLPAEEGEHPEEIYLFSRSFPETATTAEDSKESDTKKTDKAEKKPAKKENSKRYQLNLPELGKGQAYHLQFTGSHKKGQLAYHHLYNLNKSDDELASNFMPAPGNIELEGEEVNAIPVVPGIGWEAVADASMYHVTLEAGTGIKRRVIWEAFTAETQLRYPLTSKEQRLKEEETYTISVSALKGLRPATNSSKEKYAHPAYRMIWSDLARVTHRPFEVVN